MKKIILIIISVLLLFSCGQKVNFESLPKEKKDEIWKYYSKEIKNINASYEFIKIIKKDIKNNKEIQKFLKSKNIKIDDKDISTENKKELQDLIKKNFSWEKYNTENLLSKIIKEKMENKYPNVDFKNY